MFPWVVGIRGTIDPPLIESLLKFLGVQRKHWPVAVEKTVIASVWAFHFLHKVSFGGLSAKIRPDLDSENSDASSNSTVKNVSTKLEWKHCRRTTEALQHCTDSDSSTGEDLKEASRPQNRACSDRSTRSASVVAETRLPTPHSANDEALRETFQIAHHPSALSKVRGRIRKRRTSKAQKTSAHLVTAAERDSMLSVSAGHL